MAHPPRAFHWQLHSGAEVDLILELEAKSSARVTRADTRGIRAFRNSYPRLQHSPGHWTCNTHIASRWHLEPRRPRPPSRRRVVASSRRRVVASPRHFQVSVDTASPSRTVPMDHPLDRLRIRGYSSMHDRSIDMREGIARVAENESSRTRHSRRRVTSHDLALRKRGERAQHPGSRESRSNVRLSPSRPPTCRPHSRTASRY